MLVMNDVYEYLMNKELSEESSKKLNTFLKESLEKLINTPGTVGEVAYSIAGLMSTDYSRGLDESDPFYEITTIAGELEILPDNKEELRTELIDKITEFLK